MTWEELVLTKCWLWIDIGSSTDNILHSTGKEMEKSGILLQLECVAKSCNDDPTCHVLSFADAMVHVMSVTLVTSHETFMICLCCRQNCLLVDPFLADCIILY